MKSVGQTAYKRITDLFPICRSLTGAGVRETLGYIKGVLPDLQIHEIPSGTEIFDWTVPQEWVIRDAYIEDDSGQRIVDFKDNNLHVIGYAAPMDAVMSLDDLQEHIYSLPEQPEAIPYVTSYYKKRWGFCIKDTKRIDLKQGDYHVVIDSEFKSGSMTYADMVVRGKSEKEVLLSTYICHPSMANNELSGPVVTMALVEWLLENQDDLHYSYRIVFVPETIGAIAYINQHLETLQNNTIAGYVLTCIGDNNAYSFMPTPWEDSFADRLTQRVLDTHLESYNRYSFLQRGSDERQYCSPRVGLPVVSVMRSKYHEYPEYHTSLDNLDYVSADGLQGGFDIIKQCIQELENQPLYCLTTYCEPMLSKRKLYSDLGHQNSLDQKLLFDFIAFCDGAHMLDEIAKKLGCARDTLDEIVGVACEHDLVRRI